MKPDSKNLLLSSGKITVPEKYAKKAIAAEFLASKAVAREGGDKSRVGLQLIDTAVRRLEARGCRNHELPGYDGRRALDIVTNDDLRLHHVDSDTGKNIDWLTECKQYASLTRYGVLAIVDSTQSVQDWLASGACHRETQDLPPERLWFFYNDGEQDRIISYLAPNQLNSHRLLTNSCGNSRQVGADNILFQHIRRGDIAQTRRVLEIGANPNALDAFHLQPLTYAAGVHGDSHDIVKLLIEFRANCQAMLAATRAVAMFDGSLEKRNEAIRSMKKDLRKMVEFDIYRDAAMEARRQVSIARLEDVHAGLHDRLEAIKSLEQTGKSQEYAKLIADALAKDYRKVEYKNWKMPMEAIVDLLGDSDSDYRLKALELLQWQSQHAISFVEEIAKCLSDELCFVRLEACRLLQLIFQKTKASPLEASNSPCMRAAASCLNEFLTVDFVVWDADAYEDDEREFWRGEALLILAGLQELAYPHVDSIVRFLEGHGLVVDKAIEALGRLGCIAKPYAGSIKDAQWENPTVVKDALLAMDEEVPQWILDAAANWVDFA